MHQKTQNHFLKFSIHLSVRKSRENWRQIYGKSKASLSRNLSTGMPPIFLGQSFALQLQFTIDILFRTAILRKLFDIRFSYKHCNFSYVCLLVNMASKTVTRSNHGSDYSNLDRFVISHGKFKVQVSSPLSFKFLSGRFVRMVGECQVIFFIESLILRPFLPIFSPVT